MNEPGRLYLIPTPIGHLEDMTYRAVQQLKDVDLILAEDTRQTKRLLNHYAIDTPLASYHEHTNWDVHDRYIERLQQGQSIGLVSDAGMPVINDPGHPLVQAVLDAGIEVTALPGANAALTALVASGLSAERFTYYGFFPRQNKERQEILATIGSRQETAIFYESPHRINDAVQAVVDHLNPQNPIVIARELTKLHEEYLRGTAESILNQLQERPIKGEIVFLIEGGHGQSESVEELTYKDHVLLLMQEQGLTANAAIKEVAKRRQVPKREVYAAYHELSR